MGTAHDEWVRQEMIEKDPRFVKVELKGFPRNLTFTGRLICEVYGDYIYQDEDGDYLTNINGVIEAYETSDELIETLLFLMHKEED